MLAERWSDLRYRLRAIFRRGAVERELADELRAHLEHETDKHVRGGVPVDEARRRAGLAFGGVERIKDDSRDVRGVSTIEHVMRDLRYAARGLRARPLFAGVIVMTLAVGVGVDSAMFGILDRMLLRAPAYMVDPASVNRVYAQWTDAGRAGFENRFAYPRFRDLATWNRSLSNVAAFAYRRIAVGDGDETSNLQIGAVSGNFFEFFDAKPMLGRFFGAQEDALPAGELVAVVSFGYWRTHFGGVNALGAHLRIGEELYTIVGVAPEGFTGVSDRDAPVAFVPITTLAAAIHQNFHTNYGWRWLELLVRRKPGVTVDQASADLTSAFRRSWDAERAVEPRLATAAAVRATAFAGPILLARGPMAGPETRVLAWIGGVAFIVLLIACANVANLLLARSLRRRREMAVRRAIGGTRVRLVQQLLTETLVLSVLGSAAGLVAAQIVARSLGAMLGLPVDTSPVIADTRTLIFAVGLTAITALLAGLIPALSVGRGDLAVSLRAGTREGAYRQSRLRMSLLVFQTALSVVLLVGAGLFVQSLEHVRSLRLGYDVEHIAYVEASMRGVKQSAPSAAALADRVLVASSALPAVASASLIVSVPFWSSEIRPLLVAGIDSVRNVGRFVLQAGSPNYFATLGTRILRGRALSADDRATSPYVAVVSEAMAKALWKRDDALGKCFRISSDTVPCTTVVGIAEDIRTQQITADGEFTYYLPMAQYRAELGEPPMLALFVRVHSRADDVVEGLRASLQRLMPAPAYISVRPFHEIVDPTMQSWTAGARMFLAFGALALLLASIGLYAVVAFGVAQRSHELGIRIALGALPADVLRLVVGEGVRVTVGGIVAGTVVALAAARGLGPLLFHVSPRDPLIYGIVALTLITAGILASAIPAVRAARVDPNVALRTD